MAPVDRRVRAMGWVLRRLMQDRSLTAAGVAALQARGTPRNPVTDWQHDPLRGDGVRYAAALRAAGVPVRLTEYVGMPHGYLNFPRLCRSAPQALSEICAEQTAALAPVASAAG